MISVIRHSAQHHLQMLLLSTVPRRRREGVGQELRRNLTWMFHKGKRQRYKLLMHLLHPPHTQYIAEENSPRNTERSPPPEASEGPDANGIALILGFAV